MQMDSYDTLAVKEERNSPWKTALVTMRLAMTDEDMLLTLQEKPLSESTLETIWSAGDHLESWRPFAELETIWNARETTLRATDHLKRRSEGVVSN